MGAGPTKSGLVGGAGEGGVNNVHSLDARPASEVPPLLAAADVVVVPLVTHLPGATPSKLYEAMASSRPVVLVAEGEPAAIVREQQTGLVVAPGDAAGLAQAFRTLCGDAVLRERLGANGRRTAERYFNQAEIDDRFVDFLVRQHEPETAGGAV